MPIPTRHLGRNGPLVPAVGLGTMSIGGAYGQKDTKHDKLMFLYRAHEIGEIFWDTADVYFDSEDIIGEWFRKSGKRDDIFLATKFGLQYSASEGQTVRSDREYVKAACEKSLKRLGVSTIDLYYCHRVDGHTPIEETMESLVELKKEGKIRYIGLSECSAETIYRAHAVHPISAYQVEYSPFCLDIESPKLKILDTCRDLGIAVIAYSPIGRGLLSGQIKSIEDLPANDFRRLTPKYSAENFPKILQLVDRLQALASNHGHTASQACLAWILAQGSDIITIPGTRTVKYLEDNVAAADLALTDGEIQELRAHANKVKISGDRYPTEMMGPIFSDTPAL